MTKPAPMTHDEEMLIEGMCRTWRQDFDAEPGKVHGMTDGDRAELRARMRELLVMNIYPRVDVLNHFLEKQEQDRVNQAARLSDAYACINIGAGERNRLVARVNAQGDELAAANATNAELRDQVRALKEQVRDGEGGNLTTLRADLVALRTDNANLRAATAVDAETIAGRDRAIGHLNECNMQRERALAAIRSFFEAHEGDDHYAAYLACENNPVLLPQYVHDQLAAMEKDVTEAMAELRDLFPIPEQNAELYARWMAAMSSQYDVAPYVNHYVCELLAQALCVTEIAKDGVFSPALLMATDDLRKLVTGPAYAKGGPAPASVTLAAEAAAARATLEQYIFDILGMDQVAGRAVPVWAECVDIHQLADEIMSARRQVKKETGATCGPLAAVEILAAGQRIAIRAARRGADTTNRKAA